MPRTADPARSEPVGAAGRGCEDSDELLIERCREGSEAAFAQIVRRHERELQRHCAPMVGQAAADDATQDAFLCAWTAIRAGAEIRSLRPWLFTIAHRKALTQLRERRRVRMEGLSESFSDGSSSAEHVEQAAAMRDTLVALAKLPEAEREAFIGVAVHGRSGRNVARSLGVSESAARQLVFRARATLRAGAAICLGPPVAVLGWIRRLLGLPARTNAAAGGTGGLQQAAIAIKLAGVALAGATAVGAGALAISTHSRPRPAPIVAHRSSVATAGAAASERDVAAHERRGSAVARGPAPLAALPASRGAKRGSARRFAGKPLLAARASAGAAAGARSDGGSASAGVDVDTAAARGEEVAKGALSGTLRVVGTAAPALPGALAKVTGAAVSSGRNVATALKPAVAAAGHGLQGAVSQTVRAASTAVSGVGAALAPAGSTLADGVTSGVTQVASTAQALAGAGQGALTGATQAAGAAVSAATQTTGTVAAGAAGAGTTVAAGATGAVGAVVTGLGGV